MRNSRGITIIGLAVMVVIIATLALVTLNMGVGENSIMSKAEKGVKDWDEKEIIDEVNVILADYAIDVALTDKDTINTYLTELVKENRIQDYKYIGYYLVKYKDLYCELVKDGYGYKVSKVREAGDDDGDDEYVIITSEVIADKTIDLEEEKKYILLDDTDAKDFNFDIPEGEEITIILAENMTIDNKEVKRSAINLNKNSTLNLYIYADVTVNSGYGGNAEGNVPGEGAYAGIRVPPTATLNIFGTEKLTAIGGDAGDGEVSDNTSLHAGGGGAGAGIGGSGGKGGKGKNGKMQDTEYCPAGGIGESCGTVNIHDTVTVYAYGGGGGSGGVNYQGIGAGAGGYPAAGIGGGGAGGAGATCCAGAGGYSGGAAEGIATPSVNGMQGAPATAEFPEGYYMNWQGGGYYDGMTSEADDPTFDMNKNLIGGKGGISYRPGHTGGNGGKAGSGGNITVSKSANVYAYNGNMYTDGTPYLNGTNQAVIYLQAGVSPTRYLHIKNRSNKWPKNTTYDINVHSNYPTFEVQSEGKTNVTLSGYVNKLNVGVTKQFGSHKYLTAVDLSKQGVGSGAGYVEVSNGTYTIVDN